jgi:hypothetical protein
MGLTLPHLNRATGTPSTPGQRHKLISFMIIQQWTTMAPFLKHLTTGRCYSLRARGLIIQPLLSGKDRRIMPIPRSKTARNFRCRQIWKTSLKTQQRPKLLSSLEPKPPRISMRHLGLLIMPPNTLSLLSSNFTLRRGRTVLERNNSLSTRPRTNDCQASTRPSKAETQA